MAAATRSSWSPSATKLANPASAPWPCSALWSPAARSTATAGSQVVHGLTKLAAEQKDLFKALRPEAHLRLHTIQKVCKALRVKLTATAAWRAILQLNSRPAQQV